MIILPLPPAKHWPYRDVIHEKRAHPGETACKYVSYLNCGDRLFHSRAPVARKRRCPTCFLRIRDGLPQEPRRMTLREFLNRDSQCGYLITTPARETGLLVVNADEVVTFFGNPEVADAQVDVEGVTAHLLGSDGPSGRAITAVYTEHGSPDEDEA